MVEDPQVKNKVCCSIALMKGFDPEHFPFVIARNRHCLNLINVRTATLQPLIQDMSSTAWYQESLLVLGTAATSRPGVTGQQRVLYSSKECHATPRDKKLNGEHHLVRELTLDEAFMEGLTAYEGLLPTSMGQLDRIVTKKDEEIELLKLKVAQL